MGLYTHPPQTSDWWKGTDIAQHRISSYDVATLHLMAPMDFWRNSTPFFGAVAFCTTKIDHYNRSFQLILQFRFCWNLIDKILVPAGIPV